MRCFSLSRLRGWHVLVVLGLAAATVAPVWWYSLGARARNYKPADYQGEGTVIEDPSVPRRFTIVLPAMGYRGGEQRDYQIRYSPPVDRVLVALRVAKADLERLHRSEINCEIWVYPANVTMSRDEDLFKAVFEVSGVTLDKWSGTDDPSGDSRTLIPPSGARNVIIKPGSLQVGRSYIVSVNLSGRVLEQGGPSIRVTPIVMSAP